MTRALFICKTRLSYGNSYGLLNSASFVADYLNSIGINSVLCSAFDANDVDKLITYYNPLFVIVEALWITPEKLREIMSLRRHKSRLFIIRIHSRPTFIANEGIAFKWLFGYKNLNFNNLLIAPNNNEFAIDLKRVVGLSTIYLPNIYNPPKYDIVDTDSTDSDCIKIGCFGSIRPMKNHLTQAIAAIKFAQNNKQKLEFHINSTRMEQHGDQVLNNLYYLFENLSSDYKLIEHDWLSHKEFVALARQMTVGMQVSLTETFNIIAADFVYHKIPFIGSDQIEWLPSRYQVKNPNSTNEIVEYLEYALGFMGRFWRKSSIKSLIKYNKQSQKLWKKLVL